MLSKFVTNLKFPIELKSFSFQTRGHEISTLAFITILYYVTIYYTSKYSIVVLMINDSILVHKILV